MTLPASTPLHVRLDQTLDTRRNRAGDSFTAVVVSPIVENGVTVVPRGTRALGRVVDSRPSGRFSGRAELAFRLESIDVRGRRYRVDTSVINEQTGGHKKRNLTLIGGGTGFGAAVGAIAAGGPGALIGAGAGAAAGTVGAAITGKKQLRLPVETPVTFRLRSAVAVRA